MSGRQYVLILKKQIAGQDTLQCVPSAELHAAYPQRRIWRKIGVKILTAASSLERGAVKNVVQ